MLVWRDLTQVADKTSLGGYLAVDTNILIDLLDPETHSSQATREQISNIACHYKLIYFVSSLIEVMEHFRRQMLATYVAGDQIVADIGDSEFAALLSGWKEFNPITDRFIKESQIKSLRKKCQTISNNGKLWEELCTNAFTKQSFDLIETKSVIKNQYNLTYKSLQCQDLFKDASDRPNWDDQFKLMEKYGLGADDAAILNMALSNSKIKGIITRDKDILSVYRSAFDRDRAGEFYFYEVVVGKRFKKAV